MKNRRNGSEIGTCRRCGSVVEPQLDSIRKLRSGPNIGRRARLRLFHCRCGNEWALTNPIEAGRD